MPDLPGRVRRGLRFKSMPANYTVLQLQRSYRRPPATTVLAYYSGVA
jgi:hypothetical protein